MACHVCDRSGKWSVDPFPKQNLNILLDIYVGEKPIYNFLSLESKVVLQVFLDIEFSWDETTVQIKGLLYFLLVRTLPKLLTILESQESGSKHFGWFWIAHMTYLF